MISTAELSLLAARSRLASQHADQIRQRTRVLVAASRECCDLSRHAMTEPAGISPRPLSRPASRPVHQLQRMSRLAPPAAGRAWVPSARSAVPDPTTSRAVDRGRHGPVGS